MMMLQEMRNQLLFGRKLVFQKQGFLIFEKKIIGGDLLGKHDLVDQILKFFIGFEIVSFRQNEVM